MRVPQKRSLTKRYLRQVRDCATILLARKRTQAPVLGFDRPRDEDDLVLSDFEVVAVPNVFAPFTNIVPDEMRELEAGTHNSLLCSDVHKNERALL